MKIHGPRMGPVRRGISQALVATAAGAVALGGTAFPTHAQTIRPVIAEYTQSRAVGRFELVNDGLVPLNVVLEPQSFDITDEGEPVYRPLDPRIHLRLSAMSVRIPPKQTRWVFYEASAESVPAWFVIPCRFSGIRPRAGLEVRIELPHTVYLVQKEPLAVSDVDMPYAEYNPTTKTVDLALENRGPRLGRALEAVVVGEGHREPRPSFPMPPHGRRHLSIPWHSDQIPSRVLIRFKGFTVERPLGEAVRVGG
jgi:hypothetical protein